MMSEEFDGTEDIEPRKNELVVERFQDANGEWWERYVTVKPMQARRIEEEPEDEEEKERIEQERKEYICQLLDDHFCTNSDYTVLASEGDCFVVSKMVKLVLNKVFNKDGFCPVEQVSEDYKCIVAVVVFGDEPDEESLAGVLIEKGCQVVRVYTENDIGRLSKI